MKNIIREFFKKKSTDPNFKQILIRIVLIFIPIFYFYPIRFIRNSLFYLHGIDLYINDVFIKDGFVFDNNSKIKIGKNVFINNNVTFEGSGSIDIENNVQIGPNTIITTTNHNIQDSSDITKNVSIKKNTWIAASCVILPGITLGPNVIVGAGSIVTKSYENCKIVGNPAQKVI